MLKKKLGFLTAGIVFTVLLSGCLGTINDNRPITTPGVSDTPAVLSPSPVDKDDNPSPLVHNELLIYTLNAETHSIMQVTVTASDKSMDLNSFAGKVEDALEDESFVVDIGKIEIVNGNAYVRFEKGGTPKVESEEMERLLLNCIAQSVLDNVNGINGIIFGIEEGPYKTDFLSLDPDYVYLHN